MNLIIDIGNSRAKAVVMDGDALVKEYVAEAFNASLFEEIMEAYPTIERAIIASTRGDELSAKEVAETRLSRVVIFKPATTPIPLENHYYTPETLGADRLAAAIGAQALHPNADIMIVEPNVEEHKQFKLTPYQEAFDKADIVVMLTAHNQFKELPWDESKVILDFCGIYKK